jgi:hypothetical protein
VEFFFFFFILLDFTVDTLQKYYKSKKGFYSTITATRVYVTQKEKMKSSSVQKALSSGARIGAIELANCPGVSIHTPALLISTRKGLPYFTPPDLLPSLPSPDSHLLQVSPLHLYVTSSFS